MRPVHIAGVALASARGADLAEAVAQLRASRTGHTTRIIPTLDGPQPIPYFAMPRPGAEDALGTLARVCRTALAEAGLAPDSTRNMPLFIGSSSLHIAEAESGEHTGVLRGDLNDFARRLKSTLGISGADYTINTACTSSAHALLLAQALLTGDRCDSALVIGVEFANLVTAAGFYAMQLLGTAARPFDRARDGLVLGEAVAAVVLTARPGVATARPAVRLLGGANCIDTASPAAADASGAAMAALMRCALASCGVAANDITLIKAQAAGSPANDAAEARALQQVFAAVPAVTSLKAYIGHVLGASGCAELALLIACWRAGFTPATSGYTTPDPMLALKPLQQALLSGVPRHALLNYVGFGGGQAALVVGRELP
jgi:3-oxoacyl-[acyl-carrier-protein] synthase I